MISSKKALKKLFPNIIDTWNLEKQRETNRITIDAIKALGEENYPKMLQSLYQQKTGHELNLANPQRLTEKIQWRKLYDQNMIYSTLSDKYAVREWIKNTIGEEYLIPLIGVWEHFSDIDFNVFPEQFVLKTNNASHTNIIVTNKSDFMRQRWSAGRRMEYWLHTPFAYLEGLELHYKDIHPLIVAEQFIQPEDGKKELVDYKFHCFNGAPVLCQVIGDRTVGETIDFYDINWEHVALTRPPFPNAKTPMEKPTNYDLMLRLVKTLCNGFTYVRVDLYQNNDKIFFGEMTFTPASGMMKMDPDEWDYKLGALWDINSEQVNKSKVMQKG